MSNNRVYLYDTTLRDGMQSIGIDASVQQKMALAGLLDPFVDFIEGGYPGPNVVDNALFASPPHLNHSQFVAFGMTMRYKNGTPEKDAGLMAIFNSGAKGVCLVGKSSKYQARTALEITPEQNLECIDKSIRGAVDRGLVAMLDLEHFFDGYKEDPEYAMAVLRTAEQAGARWMTLCDTKGGTFDFEAYEIVSKIIAAGFDGNKLGIHAHNDRGQAIGVTQAAVRAGVRLVQGTINGIGERTGNLNLITVIPNLVAMGYDCGLDDQKLRQLTNLSRKTNTILDMDDNPNAPYVGANAFATKAGIHASAMVRDANTYNLMDPAKVGNTMKIIGGSSQSGLSNLKTKVEAMGLPYNHNTPHWTDLLSEIKEREARGYAFDEAEANLEVLIYDALGQMPAYFDVDTISLTDELRPNHLKGRFNSRPSGIAKLHVNGERIMKVAEGSGPVHAISNATKMVLMGEYPALSNMHLYDYRVRIQEGKDETGAVTRVTCFFRDTEDEQDNTTHWKTQGVSTDIIGASAEAYLLSIRWFLHKNGVQDIAADHKPALGYKPRGASPTTHRKIAGL